jgi:hypothetical protein
MVLLAVIGSIAADCRSRVLRALGDVRTLAPLSHPGARQPFGSLRSALRRVRASLFPGAVTPALVRRI